MHARSRFFLLDINLLHTRAVAVRVVFLEMWILSTSIQDRRYLGPKPGFGSQTHTAGQGPGNCILSKYSQAHERQCETQAPIHGSHHYLGPRLPLPCGLGYPPFPVWLAPFPPHVSVGPTACKSDFFEPHGLLLLYAPRPCQQSAEGSSSSGDCLASKWVLPGLLPTSLPHSRCPWSQA